MTEQTTQEETARRDELAQFGGVTRQEFDFRNNFTFQSIMDQQNMQDMNPLLAILMILFMGPEQIQQVMEQTQDRARDYSDNSSDYGTVSRRVPSSDPSGEATFESIDGFPEDFTFTRAYQQEGSLNRVYEGTDASGEAVTIIKARDSSREGTRSWANNNPGNLRYSAWEDEFGAIGQDEDGFAIFESVQAGLDAQKHLLQSDSYANLTLREAVYRYAPQIENDSETYVRRIAEETGIATNRVLNTLSDEEQNRLVLAMVDHEGWREARVLQDGQEVSPDGNTAVASAYNPTGGLTVEKPMGDGQIITSDFGPRNLAMSSMHRGIDLRTKHLDPNGNVELYARQPMVITDISENAGGYGYRVSAAIGKDDEGRAITIQYSHLDSLPDHIEVGDTLEAGDYIATTGSSGRGTGAHLDFEVRIGSQVVDPERAFTTDLSDSDNGDALIASARDTLGSRAHSGTYAARIEPSLARSDVMSAVNSLDATRAANPRLAMFNGGGVSEITDPADNPALDPSITDPSARASASLTS